jgi:DNA segregation ATPase FtsK/SpoIIIE, S-DNA-T family
MVASRSGISREYLESQADRIEHLLASHRVPVRVAGGAINPRWIRFELAPAAGAKIATIRNLSEELSLALGVPDVRLGREGQTLTLDVSRPDAQPVRLLTLLGQLSHLPPHIACLGLAEDGRPLLIRLSSPDVAHILVAGATGSGKTELMRSLLMSLALGHRQSQLQLALVDPKGRGFAPLARLPHLLAPIAATPEDAAELLNHMVAEMERRDRDGLSSPLIVVAVDELTDLMMSAGRSVETALTRLTQRGREAGIHVVAGVQKPASAVLGPILKANFPARLVGRVGSTEDARVASGVAASGAERLQGHGDFLAVAAGAVTRFQAAWLSPQDWAELSASL